jgi:large subunit ribosomal protein L31
MKANIHPNYKEIKVVCSCGNKFTTRSTMTRDELPIEICAKCHPFYTGKQKIVDTAGRVERFKNKYMAVKQAAPKQVDHAVPAEVPAEVAAKSKPKVKSKAKTTTAKITAKAKAKDSTE